MGGMLIVLAAVLSDLQAVSRASTAITLGFLRLRDVSYPVASFWLLSLQ